MDRVKLEAEIEKIDEDLRKKREEKKALGVQLRLKKKQEHEDYLKFLGKLLDEKLMNDEIYREKDIENKLNFATQFVNASDYNKGSVETSVDSDETISGSEEQTEPQEKNFFT